MTTRCTKCGRPIDAVTVGQRIRDLGAEEECGGFAR
jgi:hypothetical protein